MPRVKYLGKGFRILAVSGVGVIKMIPGEEVFVEDRVAYRMLEANSMGRKPLYEFLDQFPPVQKEETQNIKHEVILPEPPEGLLPYKGKTKSLEQAPLKAPPRNLKPKPKKKLLPQPDVVMKR
jgi:hypothetical protein